MPSILPTITRASMKALAYGKFYASELVHSADNNGDNNSNRVDAGTLEHILSLFSKAFSEPIKLTSYRWIAFVN